MPGEYDKLRVTGAVHVWRDRASDVLDPVDAALLSDEELGVMRRRPVLAGIRYAGAHAAVRRVLSAYLAVPPGTIRFGRWPCPRCADPSHGRPRILWPHTGLEFNVSRSGPYWALAVAADHQVGIDLEDGRHLDIEGASALVMSDAELVHMRAQRERSGSLAVFFRCWTRKEAVVKASGVGVIADLRTVDVGPHLTGSVVVSHTETTGPGTWLVQDLPTLPGPVAAPQLFCALAREAGSVGPVIVRGAEEGVLIS
jgi:4'-phosphopantetheinyl transferase